MQQLYLTLRESFTMGTQQALPILVNRAKILHFLFYVLPETLYRMRSTLHNFLFLKAILFNFVINTNSFVTYS